MAELDRTLLRRLGLGDDVRSETLLQRHGHSVLRLRTAEGSFVIKLWPDADAATEIAAYRLLADLGVPTVRVIAATEDALLLEDLAVSPSWHLAGPEDLDRIEVISGLAAWYRRLHDAGSPLGPWAASIPGEYDHLSPDALRATGRRLGLDREPAWRRATIFIEPLLAGWRRRPQTVIYNDFHVGNVAVRRSITSDAGPERGAIMIDFHLLRTGTRASDLRNVTGQLDPAGRAAFLRRYGPVPEIEAIVDAPLAVLGALCQLDPAARIPAWARRVCAEVGDGRLDAAIDAAVAVD